MHVQSLITRSSFCSVNSSDNYFVVNFYFFEFFREHPSTSFNRFAPIQKTNKCSQGGLIKLQNRLLQQEETTCNACQALLKNCKFDAAELTNQVEHALSTRVVPEAPQVPQDDADMEPAVAELTEEQNPDQKIPDKVDNGPEAALELLKEYEPIIELLPSGTLNKKVPFRCNACKSRGQPGGHVGEIGVLKLWAVKHFVGTHCASNRHKANVKKLTTSELAKPAQKVPCEAIRIDDPETAGRLYQYRKEFDVWASMADLDKHASHQYWQAGKPLTWHVRSASCEQETDCVEAMDRQVCAQCLSLGSSQTVSWC